MFYPVRLYIKDRWIAVSGVVSLAIFLYIIRYTLINIRPTEDRLFLHYNVIFGIDLIGTWWKLYILPTGSLLMLLINFSISYFFHRTGRFLSRFIAVMTAFLEVLLLVATNLIIGLNS